MLWRGRLAARVCVGAFCLLAMGACEGTDEGEAPTPLQDATSDAAADVHADVDAEDGSSDGEGGGEDAADVLGDGGGPDGGVVACDEPCFAWARLVDGPSNEDEIDAVASDPEGNVFISGKFEQSLRIEGRAEPFVSAGRADIMVAKYTSSGELVWARQFGGASEDNVFDAVADDRGNVILSGWFGGRVSFGETTLETTGVEDVDMMVVKLSAAGEVVWAIQAGSPEAEGGNEINMAPDGDIVVLMDSWGDPQIGQFSMVGEGRRDSYVVKLSAEDGRPRWVAQIGGSGTTRAKCLAVDSSGRVYAGGDYLGGVAAIGSAGRIDLPRARSRDAYLTAWDAQGEPRWVKAWGGEGDEFCKAAVADEQGDLYLVGPFEGAARFNEEELEGQGSDLFVWKLDSEGDSVWLRQVSGEGDEGGTEATTGPDGGIVFSHDLVGEMTYGGPAGGDVVASALRERAPAIVTYSAEGVPRVLLSADACPTGFSGEISRSGRRIYVDVPFFGRPGQIECALGESVQEATGGKDGLLLAVDL